MPTVLDLGGGQQQGFMESAFKGFEAAQGLKKQRHQMQMQLQEEQRYQTELAMAQQKHAQEQDIRRREIEAYDAAQKQGQMEFEARLGELGVDTAGMGGMTQGPPASMAPQGQPDMAGMGGDVYGPPAPSQSKLSPEARAALETEMGVFGQLSPEAQQRRLPEIEAMGEAIAMREDTDELLSEENTALMNGKYSSAPGAPIDPQVKQAFDAVAEQLEKGQLKPAEAKRQWNKLAEGFKKQRLEARTFMSQKTNLAQDIAELEALAMDRNADPRFKQMWQQALEIDEDFMHPNQWPSVSARMQALMAPPRASTTARDPATKIADQMIRVHAGGKTTPEQADEMRSAMRAEYGFPPPPPPNYTERQGTEQGEIRKELRKLTVDAKKRKLSDDELDAAVVEFADSIGMDPNSLPPMVRWELLSIFKGTKKSIATEAKEDTKEVASNPKKKKLTIVQPE